MGIWMLNHFTVLSIEQQDVTYIEKGEVMQVEVRSSIEEAITQFKKKVEKDGLLRELKSKQFFLSRSERRRMKDREAATRKRKSERKRETGRRGRTEMRHTEREREIERAGTNTDTGHARMEIDISL
jgi:small subunit ribosomal protein S21